MSDAISLTEPEPVGALPGNYLPAAGRALRGDPDAPNRLLFLLPPERNEPSLGVDYFVVPPDVMASADAMQTYLGNAFPTLGTDEIAARCMLGPPTDLPASTAAAPVARRMCYSTTSLEGRAAIRRAVVVIDLGIAFWNPRFQNGAGPQFRDMQFFDLDASAAAGGAIGALGAGGIGAMTAKSRLPDGQRQIITDLGRMFPGSFYAPELRPQVNDLWHGTAVADLAAGEAGDNDGTALFGIELPRLALADRKGDALGAILPFVVEAALAMTASLADVPRIIVLPFAFPAGPHDGSHPVARGLANVLATARRVARAQGGGAIELVLPAGNHLQDRSAARIMPPGQGGLAGCVGWHVPPDDFSANIVEVIAVPSAATVVPALILRAPTGEVHRFAPPVPGKAFLMRRGQRIGAIWRADDTAGRVQFWVILFATAIRRANEVPAPFGTWEISVAGCAAADLWVLRDDADRTIDRSQRHRQSHFTDQGYRRRAPNGDFILSDPVAGPLRRSGSASLLTTAEGVCAVQADERLGAQPARQAWYSGRAADGAPFVHSVTVDDGWPDRGLTAAGNGTQRRFRMSGSSAAAAVFAGGLYD